MEDVGSPWDTQPVQTGEYSWLRTKGGGNTKLLRDDIYRVIRNSILRCDYAPGQELREQMLADLYRVSRSPIRDSLLRLQQENLVTVLPRHGYLVNPISAIDTGEICALRLLIEPACAAAAAGADDPALEALDRFRGFAQGNFEQIKFVGYNKAFHRAVISLAANKRLTTIGLDLIDQFERFTRASLSLPNLEVVRRMCAEHEAIIDALQAHDSERASELTYRHVVRANERIAATVRSAAASAGAVAD